MASLSPKQKFKVNFCFRGPRRSKEGDYFCKEETTKWRRENLWPAFSPVMVMGPGFEMARLDGTAPGILRSGLRTAAHRCGDLQCHYDASQRNERVGMAKRQNLPGCGSVCGDHAGVPGGRLGLHGPQLPRERFADGRASPGWPAVAHHRLPTVIAREATWDVLVPVCMGKEGFRAWTHSFPRPL
jgi:hypothetical protein